MESIGAEYKQYKPIMIENGISGLVLAQIQDANTLKQLLIELQITKSIHQRVIVSNVMSLIAASSQQNYSTQNIFGSGLSPIGKIGNTDDTSDKSVMSDAIPNKNDGVYNGIRFSAIEDFIDSIGESKLSTMNARKVFEQFMTPLLLGHLRKEENSVMEIGELQQSVSYCDVLLHKAGVRERKQVACPADTFISYDRSSNVPFLTLVKAIRSQCKTKTELERRVFWFDLFCKLPTPTNARKTNMPSGIKKYHHDFWENSYRELIQNCGFTLLILSPLDTNGLTASPLTNAQTLYDIYCTASNDVSGTCPSTLAEYKQGSQQQEPVPRLQVTMTEVDKEIFQQSILPNFDALHQLLSSVFVPTNTTRMPQPDGEGTWAVGVDNDLDEVDFSSTSSMPVTMVGMGHGDNRAKKDGLYSILDKVGDDCIRKTVTDSLIHWMIGLVRDLPQETEDDKPSIVQSKHSRKRSYQMQATAARLYQLIGNYSMAEMKYNESLASCQALHGTVEHPAILPILMQQGEMLVLADRLSQAEACFNQCITYGRAYHDRQKAQPQGDTGHTYGSESPGHSKGAHTGDSPSPLKSSPSKQGGNRVDMESYEALLQALSTLGGLYYDRGQYKRALSLYEESVERMTERFGPHHVITLGALHNLAVLCTKLSDFTIAESLFKECLEIKNNILGTDHPSTLNTLSLLADLHYSTENYAMAEEHYEECAAIQKARLGMHHASYLMTSHNRAVLMLKNVNRDCVDGKAKLEESTKLLEECLENMRNSPSMGDNHCRTLTCALWLATAYCSQQKLLQAKQKSEGEKPEMKELSPREIDFLSKAKALMIECTEGRRKVLGQEHVDTITASNNLAGLFKQLGNWRMAEDMYSECLKAVNWRLQLFYQGMPYLGPQSSQAEAKGGITSNGEYKSNVDHKADNKGFSLSNMSAGLETEGGDNGEGGVVDLPRGSDLLQLTCIRVTGAGVASCNGVYAPLTGGYAGCHAWKNHETKVELWWKNQWKLGSYANYYYLGSTEQDNYITGWRTSGKKNAVEPLPVIVALPEDQRLSSYFDRSSLIDTQKRQVQQNMLPKGTDTSRRVRLRVSGAQIEECNGVYEPNDKNGNCLSWTNPSSDVDLWWKSEWRFGVQATSKVYYKGDRFRDDYLTGWKVETGRPPLVIIAADDAVNTGGDGGVGREGVQEWKEGAKESNRDSISFKDDVKGLDHNLSESRAVSRQLNFNSNLDSKVQGKDELAFANVAITTMTNLVMLYCSMGQFQKAESLYEECLEYITMSLGSTHPKYESVRNTFVKILYVGSNKGDRRKDRDRVKTFEKRNDRIRIVRLGQ